MTALVQRYRAADRINHWVVAACFVLLTLSGLAFFHPLFFPLSFVLGGPVWSRILHPFIGIVLVLCFAGLALRFWRENLLKPVDIQWIKRIREVINNEEGPHHLPVGKYNAGQKLMFWAMAIAIVVLLISGIPIWRAYFAHFFWLGLTRFAFVVHMLAAIGGILALIAHVYSSIWIKGTTRAMTRGTVTAAWAQHHHPAWYRQMMHKDD